MRQTNMKKPEIAEELRMVNDAGQKGTAVVIALFVLALLSVFVAFAVSRTTAESVAIGNETSEARAQYAAQGCLETMTRNFNKVFETKLNPLPSDIANVENGDNIPGLSREIGGDYELAPTAVPSSTPITLTLSAGPYAGLFAIRDSWRLRCNGTSIQDGTQVELSRYVLNNRIPIFQFGIFYNDDLELFRPPRFSFGGRVHSNGNFFISPGAEGIYFDSRVTAVGHIVTQTWRNWNTSDMANNETWIRNAAGTPVRLGPTQGSVLNTTFGNANNVFQFPPAIPEPIPTPNADLPPSRLNPAWTEAPWDGNLRARAPVLRLPLNVGQGTDLVEMVKRGKDIANPASFPAGGDLFMNGLGNLAPVAAAADIDNPILRSERFANKTGIRVSLADSKAKLPGCASGVGTNPLPIPATPCGVRLDGDISGNGTPAAAGQRGYQPKAMRSAVGGPYNYVPTRVNGERLATGGTREVWIKVETVQTNAVTGLIETVDITEDILSLGVTEEAPVGLIPTYVGVTAQNGTATAPSANLTATVPQQGASLSTYPDSRSIIKIQTFAIQGAGITTPVAPNSLLTSGGGLNVVRRFTNATAANFGAAPPFCPVIGALPNQCANDDRFPDVVVSEQVHLRRANGLGFNDSAIVPFPIQMFDTREGTYFDNVANTPAAPNVSRNGVMSMINIDVANLRRFLRGDFNNLFPNNVAPNVTPATTRFGRGLLSTDIPSNQGWVLYISDRRGDGNFDGEYDMEDVYGANPGNNNALDPGEDLDGPVGPNQRFGAGLLDIRYIDPVNPALCAASPIAVPANCEAARYSHTYSADRAAVTDHPYYRRGVRLVNGTVLPGIYDAATPANTRGFTVASENGVYVLGNYNATGATAPPANGNTPFNQYFPFNSPTHIPASIVADAVTILSNNWNDALSFTSPYNQANRDATTTQMRFAMISGDTISTRQNAVNQGSSVNGQNENGGVHNFKRFLEQWDSAGGVRLDYAGSLINLFVSRNNNGAFKCCNTVYNPPRRNWVFDSTFLDPTRIPPGTPFFQYVQTTGFERTNQ